MNKPELPHNSEIESQVLGMIMLDNSVIDRIPFLDCEHFYVPLHQKIFKACKDNIASGRVVTPIILKNQFESDPDFPPAYLANCAGTAGNHTNTVAYAEYIYELSCRRNLIAACDAAKDLLAKDGNDLHEISCKLADSCDKVTAGGKKWEMRKGSVVTQEIIDDMNKNVQPYSTGIERLDKAMDGGLMPRSLYAFAGRQKSGKTILAGTISVNLAMKDVKHLFICAEMSDKQIHQRNLARMGGFYTSAFRSTSGYKKSGEFCQKLANSMRWNHDNIIFVNAPSLTLNELKNYVKQAVKKHGIKGYILDYWQLVDGREKNKNTSEHLYEVAQWMAASTKLYDIFSIVTVQLNQEGNTFGSEGIRKSCDQLYEIQRPDPETSPDMSKVWLKMMDSRNTAYVDIGSENDPKLQLNSFGPYIEELELTPNIRQE